MKFTGNLVLSAVISAALCTLLATSAEAQPHVFSAAKLQNEPYRPLTAVKAGKDVPASPDPLVSYRWKRTGADDDLQIYLLKPCTMTSPGLTWTEGMLQTAPLRVMWEWLTS